MVVLGIVVLGVVPVCVLEVPACPLIDGLVVAEPVALVPVCPIAVPADPAVPALVPAPAVPAACILAAITPAVAKPCNSADGRPFVQWSATFVASVTWNGV